MSHANIAGDRLLGLNFFPPRLDGAVYHYSLGNFLPELMQDGGLQTWIRVGFMHDDAPQYFLLTVWEFLNKLFPEQWIGQGGPTASPTHSTV